MVSRYEIDLAGRPLVLETGPRVGDGVRRWGHVRMFSPWKYAIDSAAAGILSKYGWVPPSPDEYPADPGPHHFLTPGTGSVPGVADL